MAPHVYQISEQQKKQVSDESLAAARAMAHQEHAKRIAQIDMSEHQAGVYEALRGAVSKEISQLRVVLQSAEAKKSERKWLRNQISGLCQHCSGANQRVCRRSGRQQAGRRRGW